VHFLFIQISGDGFVNWIGFDVGHEIPDFVGGCIPVHFILIDEEAVVTIRIFKGVSHDGFGDVTAENKVRADEGFDVALEFERDFPVLIELGEERAIATFVDVVVLGEGVAVFFEKCGVGFFYQFAAVLAGFIEKDNHFVFFRER